MVRKYTGPSYSTEELPAESIWGNLLGQPDDAIPLGECDGRLTYSPIVDANENDIRQIR